jgi:hypothetical protein
MVNQWIKTGLLAPLLFFGNGARECGSYDWGSRFDKYNANLDRDVKRRGMSSKLTFEIVARGTWGDGPNEIPLVLENYPSFGYLSSEQMRKIRAPVRIRLNPQGSIHALSDAPLRTPDAGPVFIDHFNAEGNIIRKTPVLSIDRPNTDELMILDYVVDAAGNSYLLERIHSRQSNQSINRLRKIKPDGEIQWSRTGPVSDQEFDFNSLKGSFTKLLMDGRSRLYLPATHHTGAIAEIDPATGAVTHVYTSDKFSNQVFMNDLGVISYILYFPDLNRRGIGHFNLADQRFTFFVGGVEIYGALLYPFGVDASSNMYVWNDSAIARISPDGNTHKVAAFDNIVVRPSDGAIFSSRLLSGHERSSMVLVERHPAGGGSTRRELQLPEDLSARFPGKGGGWKLIQVDEKERYTIFGGEEPGHAGTLLVYSSNGNLEERMTPPPDLLPIESTLENHSFWEVDAHGRVYLPVIAPQGFKVIRLSPE